MINHVTESNCQRGLAAKQALHRPGTATTSDRDYVAKTGTLTFAPATPNRPRCLIA